MWGQVRSGQVSLSMGKSGQVKSGEVRPCLVLLDLSLLCYFTHLLKFYSGRAVDLWSCFYCTMKSFLTMNPSLTVKCIKHTLWKIHICTFLHLFSFTHFCIKNILHFIVLRGLDPKFDLKQRPNSSSIEQINWERQGFLVSLFTHGCIKITSNFK